MGVLPQKIAVYFPEQAMQQKLGDTIFVISRFLREEADKELTGLLEEFIDMLIEQYISLCSHCHNQIHYGMKEDVRRLVSKLFLSRENEICSILGRKISLDDLYRIYRAI